LSLIPFLELGLVLFHVDEVAHTFIFSDSDLWVPWPSSFKWSPSTVPHAYKEFSSSEEEGKHHLLPQNSWFLIINDLKFKIVEIINYT